METPVQGQPPAVKTVDRVEKEPVARRIQKILLRGVGLRLGLGFIACESGSSDEENRLETIFPHEGDTTGASSMLPSPGTLTVTLDQPKVKSEEIFDAVRATIEEDLKLHVVSLNPTHDFFYDRAHIVVKKSSHTKKRVLIVVFRENGFLSFGFFSLS